MSITSKPLSDVTVQKVPANGPAMQSLKVPPPAMTEAKVHEAAPQDSDARPMVDADFQRMRRVPRIKTLRRALQLTQEEFSTRYGIPIGTLRDWEQGRSRPDQPTRTYLMLIAQNAEPLPLSKRDRFRRVIIVTQNFIRNLAYYRAGQSPAATHLLEQKHGEASFWRQMNGNCIDICVLEWCKLFGDRNGAHDWRNVVSDPRGFEDSLLKQTPRRDLDELIVKMRRYRNKFVAHLDEDREMDIPKMDIAYRAVNFYHDYIATYETSPGDLANLSEVGWLGQGYKQCFEEATKIFRRS